ncbi:hypothetical protein S7711_10908 [Stachybotrys chartarum IBT 7711]|uniref:Uncharacterized protein n=1 Tax=Stachybotrys chartarum (strain CBS 109288 / IBT 7711) TaxID=1280523 RepID=A0A084B6D6_STACB|nr:hypothetical protein S7711_10908 [Stachybotrys chartarum IBT 7711]
MFLDNASSETRRESLRGTTLPDWERPCAVGAAAICMPTETRRSLHAMQVEMWFAESTTFSLFARRLPRSRQVGEGVQHGLLASLCGGLHSLAPGQCVREHNLHRVSSKVPQEPVASNKGEQVPRVISQCPMQDGFSSHSIRLRLSLTNWYTWRR